MSAYAIARLHDAPMHADIVTYLERIDATLAPYDGRFLVHGGAPEVLEGAWTEHVVVIAFPDMKRANDWYGSPAYQAILPLRTQHLRGDAILIEGVDASHRATDILAPAQPAG